MSTTFSIEIFKKSSDGKSGCIINEYNVCPCCITTTTADLLSKVELVELAEGIDIQIRKEG